MLWISFTLCTGDLTNSPYNAKYIIHAIAINTLMFPMNEEYTKYRTRLIQHSGATSTRQKTIISFKDKKLLKYWKAISPPNQHFATKRNSLNNEAELAH